MRRLFLADIHATLPALDAVLERAGSVDAIYCLGDIVGYGPHPGACIDRLIDLDAHCLLGNHDREVLEPPPAIEAPLDGHHSWLRWTYAQLSPSQRRFLASCPQSLRIELGGRAATLIHGDQSRHRLHPNMPDRMIAAGLGEVAGEIILFGHFHCRFERTIGGRRYVGLKAVGQARQRDPWAGYAIEQDGHLAHYVAHYDHDDVARDLDAIGLPTAFRERWERYLRSGFDSEWSHPWPV